MLITLVIYFLMLFAISRLTSRHAGNAAFFRGNRKSPWPMVAFGMVGASISGITFVSVPGMVLKGDMTYLQMCLGFIPGYFAVAFLLLPIYYKLNLTTIYGYLRQRLGRSSYKTGAAFFIASKLVGAAVRFYVVCFICIDNLRATIVQPRIDNLSEYEITVEELTAWAANVLAPAAEKAYKGEGPQTPGAWCQFCKVKNQCRALANKCKEVVAVDPKLITPEELAKDVLPMVPIVKTWISGVEDFALAQALSGIQLPGWKIVEGRSVRKITDTDSVAAVLTKNGYKQNDIFKPVEMRTITDLEKLVGKKQFAAMCGEWINKPQGKPTLAPEGDKRKAIDPIADDFKGINID